MTTQAMAVGINNTFESEKNLSSLKSKVSSYLQQSWCSQEKINLLMDLVIEKKPQVCVEIGVFTGSSLLPIAVALKQNGSGKIFAIDPWSNAEAVKNLSPSDPNRDWWGKIDMNAALQTFKNMIRTWKVASFCTILHKTSAQAASSIHSIDLLHLDGNFSHDNSLEDATIYLPKVKLGGYILLSNVLWSSNNEHPKSDSLFYLLEYCDVIQEIEGGNALLLQKNFNP